MSTTNHHPTDDPDAAMLRPHSRHIFEVRVIWSTEARRDAEIRRFARGADALRYAARAQRRDPNARISVWESPADWRPMGGR
jgi:hypothetical protein